MKHDKKSESPRILGFLILAMASLLAMVPSPGRAADITWTGGGGNSDWGNPLNWNGGSGPVPGATDIAYITADGAFVNREDDLVVGGIVLGGASGTATLRLFGPSATFGDFTILTLNSASTVNEHGEIHMSGARIEGSGSLTLGGTLLCAYLDYIDTPITTTPTSHMKLIGDTSGDSQLQVANGFVNRGTITMSTILVPSRHARLEVANGTLVNDSTGLIEALAGIGGERVLQAELDNQGTVRIETPLSLTLNSDADNLNSGLIEVSGGDFLVLHSTAFGATPTFTNTGTITVNSGRTWRVQNGTLFQNAGHIAGDGTLSLTGGASGVFNTPLEIRAIAASVSTISLTSDLSTAVTGLTLYDSSLNGPVTVTNAPGQTVTVTAATVINTAWHNEGTLVAGPGSSRINGPITTSATSRIRVEGNGSQGQGALTCLNGFTNMGSVEMGSTSGGADAILNVTNGTLVNGPGATIEAQAGTGGDRYFNAALDNQGLLTTLAKMHLTKSSAQHVNSGEINVAGGDFKINHSHSGQTPTFRNLGKITVATGRTLHSSNALGVFINAVGGELLGRGTYIFDAPMVSEGTISPGASPGICSMTGSVAFSGGTLDIEVGGPTVGTDYDRLAVSGSVTFDGTLRVTFLDGFCTQPGEVFRVVTAGASVGTFDSIEILGTGNAVLDLQYDATGLSLSTVSDLLTVDASAGAGGLISPSGPIPISCGSDLTLNIIPATGFGVANVLVDGSSVGPVTSYSFQDIDENHTIVASFVDIAAPTSQVLAPNGGETLLGGQIEVIHWNAADNVAVDSVEVDYSVQGPGGPWVNVLRSGAPVESVNWLVPDQCTETAVVRVSVLDAAGNVASDLSDAVFKIGCTAGVSDPLPTILSLQIPNPARAGSVPIRLALPVATNATLEIIDVMGRRIWSTEFYGVAGQQELNWNAREVNSGPGRGVYFARLLTPLGKRQVRFVVLR